MHALRAEALGHEGFHRGLCGSGVIECCDYGLHSHSFKEHVILNSLKKRVPAPTLRGGTRLVTSRMMIAAQLEFWIMFLSGEYDLTLRLLFA